MNDRLDSIFKIITIDGKDETDYGFYLKKFLEDFDKNKREYKGYLLIYKREEELEHLEDVRRMAIHVKNQLEQRFEQSNNILEKLQFLDITNLKSDLKSIHKEEIGAYKKIEITAAVDFYNDFFDLKNPNVMDRDTVLSEWKEC